MRRAGLNYPRILSRRWTTRVRTTAEPFAAARGRTKVCRGGSDFPQPKGAPVLGLAHAVLGRAPITEAPDHNASQYATTSPIDRARWIIPSWQAAEPFQASRRTLAVQPQSERYRPDPNKQEPGCRAPQWHG